MGDFRALVLNNVLYAVQLACLRVPLNEQHWIPLAA